MRGEQGPAERAPPGASWDTPDQSPASSGHSDDVLSDSYTPNSRTQGPLSPPSLPKHSPPLSNPSDMSLLSPCQIGGNT